MTATIDKGLDRVGQPMYGLNRGCLGRLVVGLSWLEGQLGWLELAVRLEVGRCVWCTLAYGLGVAYSHGARSSVVGACLVSSRAQASMARADPMRGEQGRLWVLHAVAGRVGTVGRRPWARSGRQLVGLARRNFTIAGADRKWW